MTAKREKNNRKSSSHIKRGIKRDRTRRHLPAEKKITSPISKSEKKQKDIKKVPQRPITGWRLWLFRVVALTVIPTLLFLLLELGLRIVGYGFPAAATIKYEVNGRVSYCNNVKFGWRFWPRNIAREFTGFIIPADKPGDTYRIFVLGGSVALGTPEPSFSFSRILQIMLREKYPGINFEVINTAMPAVNSHVVLEIIKDCAKHKGDLFIVYLGNNEVIGPYGAGTVFAPLSSSLSFIRFDKALKTVRLGQLLTNILQRRAQRDLPKIWGGNRMFMENLIRATNPDLQIVYQHYQRNLEDIGRIARKSGAKIIFSTVGSNLKDCPPFASLYQPDMTESDEKKWNDIYQQAIACETAGKYTDAVRHYLAAAEIDDSYAELQFRLGRCYWAMAEYDKAREKYIQARELDALRLRADNQINNIIRSVAGDKTAEGVYLVDAVKVTEKNSPHDIPGEKLFYEHVHYNFNGNYLLAGTVFEQVKQILPDWIKAHKTNKPLVTSQECEQHLAYTDWDRLQIAYYILNSFTKKAPFTSRLDNKKLVERMAKEVKALETYRAQESLKKSAAQYRQAILMWPGDWQLHWKYGQLLFIDLKNHQAAAEQFRLVNKYCPHSYFGYTALGEASATLGDFDGAVASLLEAARIKPTHFGAYFRLANLYEHLGKIGKAREYYAKTLKYHPGHVPACANLATILFNQGKIAEAEQTIRQGKIYAPQSLDLNYYLGIMFERQGRTREAIEEFRTILQRDPNSTKARNKLNALLKKANEI